MPTDVPAHDPTRPVGRSDLITAVETTLAAGSGVLLSGPDGIGKTTVLDAVASAAAARGERVLRVSAAETERWLPYAGLADLLGQVPADVVAGLPEPQLAAIDALLHRATGPFDQPTDRAELARRLAVGAVLAACTAGSPVLLVVDDAQWLDAASAGVIGAAVRRLSGLPANRRRLRTVAAQARPTQHARLLCPPPAVELTVPPMAAHDLAELLEAHGLPCRAASRLRAESGGNPYLALALGGAFAHRAGPAWRPAPLPARVAETLRGRLEALPSTAAETLFYAAVTSRPTVSLLRQAGRTEAEHDVHLAAAAGLVVVDGPVVRFTPAAVATVLTARADAALHAAAHTVLAEACADPIERARHRAMISNQPDAEVARSLVAAAEAARSRGARGLVADLYLLAADRTPGDLHAERLDWLVAAAEAAAAVPRGEPAARAAEAVLAADAPPAHRVRARIALIDLAGQSIGEMDEAFAAALADAGGDPALLAPLQLRLAWQAILEGATERATAAVAEAVATAQVAGDTITAAMARGTQAHLQRIAGQPEYTRTLAAALAGPQPPLAGWLHLTPQYRSARFAVFDDRLDEARADLLRMLAVAERGGGEELVEVLRSLAEVAVRAGRCRQALDFATRAAAVAEEAGLSPGPSWYTMSMVELAGGGLVKAAAYAERGVRASEQEHDGVYLRRNLHSVGVARLRSGDPRRAAAALARLRDLEERHGATDPSVLRWHGDLAAALTALGEVTAAQELLASARRRAEELGRSAGVLAGLDRAAALVMAERGDPGAAARLARAAARRFADLGQPIEHGHTLLVLGQAERRRRRFAAARATITEALEVFVRVGAKPWLEQAAAALARVEGGSDQDSVLTAAEARIAALVRQGASNREIATQIFVSVKTVEATLTRIYRKLGVRSRTQLTSRLGGG